MPRKRQKFKRFWIKETGYGKIARREGDIIIEDREKQTEICRGNFSTIMSMLNKLNGAVDKGSLLGLSKGKISYKKKAA